jgi:hypothetical protein
LRRARFPLSLRPHAAVPRVAIPLRFTACASRWSRRGSGLARLDKLDLGFNNLGDALRPLADSPHLGPLTRLDLYGNNLPPALLDALRARLGWRVRA